MSTEEKVSLLEKGATPQPQGCCHPTGFAYKYMILFVVSLICFGSYFAYDEIEPLEKQINTALGIDHGSFGLLYSVYSIPNMFLVFFGGILGDKIGLRLAGLIFVTLVLLGSAVTALGIQFAGNLMSHRSAFILTAFGRTLFGSGSESLNVIQTSMTSRWFAGSSTLAFAMGLVLSMSRLGDYLALALSASIAGWIGDFRWVLWIGCALCGLSFLSVLLYNFLDKVAEKHFPNRETNPEENAVNFRAVLHFDIRFWLVAVVCMCYYGGIFPFVAVCSDFLQTQYSFSPKTAGWYASAITLASMVLSPFLGFFLDAVGRRPFFVLLGSACVIPAHIVLGLNLPYPIIPIIVIGLSFSMVPSALWPSVPMLVKDNELATAFGTMAAIQNTGLAIINYVAGKIADKYGYHWVMYFFAMMDGIGLLFAIFLVITDKARGGTLTSVVGKKKADPNVPSSISNAPPPINDAEKF